MNKTFLNVASLNSAKLNLVGTLIRKKGSEGNEGGGGGDVPSGYDEFITAEGLVFSAVDGDFYVKL